MKEEPRNFRGKSIGVDLHPATPEVYTENEVDAYDALGSPSAHFTRRMYRFLKLLPKVGEENISLSGCMVYTGIVSYFGSVT